MSDAFAPEQATALVQAFIKAAVHDRDDEAVKKLVTKASAEQGSFNPPPDAGEMTIELGAPTQEDAEWIVPVTISDPNDSSKPVINTPFTIVHVDGEPKIDMIRTMERMFGGNMDTIMDGMVDALKGVGEAMAEGMKQAFEGIGEAMSGAFDASSDPNLDRVPDDASPELIDVINIFNEQVLPDQLSLMREAVGNEMTFHVDWQSFEGDVEAAKRIVQKVLHNVRSAVCLSSSDDQLRDQMRENLRAVSVRHVSYPEGKVALVNSGCLQIVTNLNEVGPEVGYHSSSDLMEVIKNAYGSVHGPITDRLLTQVIPDLKTQLNEHLDLDVEIDIDLASFVDDFDTDTAGTFLQKLESDIFRNFIYHIREVNQQVPLAGKLSRVHFKHVMSAMQRVMFVRGDTLVFHISFIENDGYYGANDLDHLLPAVAMLLPDYSDPSARSEYGELPAEIDVNSAFALLGMYRDHNMADLEPQIDEAVGRRVDVEIDWASFGDNAFAAEQLRYWGLNRVLGAFRWIALDEQAQQDMLESISAVKINCVSNIDEKSVELSDGVLTLNLCLTEAETGCFYERDIADKITSSMGSEWKPLIEGIRESAEYWEKQFTNDHDMSITYFIDFAGFTSDPDDNRVRFAFANLREHGIDAIYYAITGLFETNPNFKEQFGKRVRRLIVNHVHDASLKHISSMDDALVYQLFLHEGYKGYLTIDQLKKQLPALIAGMEDIVDEAADDATEPMDTSELEQTELDRMERFADEQGEGDEDDSSDDGDSELDDAEASVFEQMKASIDATMPNFSQQFTAIVGKAIPMSIDWDSLDGDQVAVSLLLNSCLSPLLGGFMMLAQDASYRDDVAKYVTEIQLSRAATMDDQSLRLSDGTLTMTVYLSQETPITISAEEAASIFRGLIDYVRAQGKEIPAKPAAKKADKPAAKSPAKKAPAKKAPAKKTTASKTKAKPATKSSAKAPVKKKSPGKGGKGKGKA